MRKLLLILLILLPANVFAEIISLSCKNDHDSYKEVIHLNFSLKKVFNNSGKIIGTNLYESGNMIYYIDDPSLILVMREKYPEFQKVQTIIDRTIGKRTERMFYNKQGDQDIIYSTCESISTKKKF